MPAGAMSNIVLAGDIDAMSYIVAGDIDAMSTYTNHQP